MYPIKYKLNRNTLDHRRWQHDPVLWGQLGWFATYHDCLQADLSFHTTLRRVATKASPPPAATNMSTATYPFTGAARVPMQQNDRCTGMDLDIDLTEISPLNRAITRLWELVKLSRVFWKYGKQR
jgi:hypothetical protein